MNYKYQEVALYAFLLLLGIFLLHHTFAEQYGNVLHSDEPLPLMFYPQLVLGAWCLLTLIMLAQALRRSAVQHGRFEATKVALALALIGILIAGIFCVGFLAASIPFTFIFARFLGYKRQPATAAAAILIPFILYVIFTTGLQVIMPSPYWEIF